jgi:exoribonuclease-2
VVRGKPENFNRPDYNFRLDGNASGRAQRRRDGAHQRAQARRAAGPDRQRGDDPGQQHWGGWLAELGVPGIYRSQASLAPGIKVRMGTKPAPHAGMGVAQYTWATSPLRRYVDLVNQWQIIACARHGRTAALVAPFKPKDAMLFSVISQLRRGLRPTTDFQSGIERYWTLRWLQQNRDRAGRAVMKDGLVRADTLPLVFKAIGADNLPRHARVRVRITGIDLLTLDLHASLIARLDDQSRPPRMRVTPRVRTTSEVLDNAGPLTLAIDVSDADAPTRRPPTA